MNKLTTFKLVTMRLKFIDICTFIFIHILKIVRRNNLILTCSHTPNYDRLLVVGSPDPNITNHYWLYYCTWVTSMMNEHSFKIFFILFHLQNEYICLVGIGGRGRFFLSIDFPWLVKGYWVGNYFDVYYY